MVPGRSPVVWLVAVGTVWESAHPIETAKADDLRALGVDLTLAVSINLVYSAAGSAWFVWMAIRAFRIWQAPHPTESSTSLE
jgi:hypothetical protein